MPDFLLSKNKVHTPFPDFDVLVDDTESSPLLYVDELREEKEEKQKVEGSPINSIIKVVATP